jgi:hypothetical protein
MAELADQVPDTGVVASESIPQPEPQVAIEPKEAEPKKPASVRDHINASIKEVRAKEDEAGRFHGKDGKFVPKVEKPVEPKAPAEIQAKQEAPPAPVSTPAVGPPPGWSAESKAAFNSLPDHFKNDVLKREKEVSDGFKKYSDGAKAYEEIEKVLAPVASVYQQAGLRPSEAVARLIQWEGNIRQNPAAALARLAQLYNVDLASLAQNPGLQAPDASLQRFIEPVSQQLNSVKTELSNLQAERAATEIREFSKDKPHFEKVKTAMGQLMAKGAATSLDQAYQMATWTDPEIRSELMKSEVDSKLAQTQQEAQKRAEAAKKAAISPSGRAPTGEAFNGKEKPKGVRGSIMAAVNQLREERA